MEPTKAILPSVLLKMGDDYRRAYSLISAKHRFFVQEKAAVQTNEPHPGEPHPRYVIKATCPLFSAFIALRRDKPDDPTMNAWLLHKNHIDREWMAAYLEAELNDHSLKLITSPKAVIYTGATMCRSVDDFCWSVMVMRDQHNLEIESIIDLFKQAGL